MPRKRRLVNGASVSAYVRFLHPSKPFRDKYLAEYDKARIGDLSVLGKEEKTIQRRPVLCVLATHQDYTGESFHVAIRNIKVESKGPPDDFFDQVAPPEAGEERRNSGPAADNTEEVPNPYIGGGFILKMTPQQQCEDDDNEPAPENVPRQEARQADCQYGEWSFDGIDNRLVGNHSNTGASFVGMSKEKVSVLSPLNLFFIIFPTDYIKNIILPKTNESLSEACNFGEFIVFYRTMVHDGIKARL
jgi:hypothetical protein